MFCKPTSRLSNIVISSYLESRGPASDKEPSLVGLFLKIADQKWDLDRFDEEVRRSQARRLVVYDALRNGQYFPWDYQPLKQASERFMRNHMNLNEVEHNQMFPRSK